MAGSPLQTKTSYRAEIDGLRAVAVVPVVTYHLDKSLIPGGYLGVDIFFVISGFLIASILFREMDAGTFCYRDFWIRRIKRLFPVAAAVIVVTSLMGCLILFNDELKSLSNQGLAALTFSSNFYFWTHTNNYWGQAAETMPLLHTWSLAVEEQFYLFFPLLLLTIKKTCWPRKEAALLTMGLIGVIVAAAGHRYFPSAAFYLLPTRMWELLLGCLGAAFLPRYGNSAFISSARASILATTGLVLIHTCLLWHPSDKYSLLHAFGITTGTTLILFHGRCLHGIAGKFLTFPPLVFLGKISYSLYLWHWPVIVLGKLGGIHQPVLLAFISFTAAVLSYFLIEQKTRYLATYRFFPLMGVALIALGCSLAVPYLYKPEGISYNIPKFTSSINLEPGNQNPSFNGFTGNYREGLVLSNRPHPFRLDVLLLGDSHSLMQFPAVEAACRALGASLAFYGADGGTSPFIIGKDDVGCFTGAGGWTAEQRVEFDKYRQDFAARYNPKLIIICGRWDFHAKQFGQAQFTAHLEDWVLAAPEAHLLFLSQPPVLPFGEAGFNSGFLNTPPFRQYEENQFTRDSRVAANGFVEQFCSSNHRCHFVDIGIYFNSQSTVFYRKGRELFYKDDDHLSCAGSMRCLPLIQENIKVKLASLK